MPAYTDRYMTYTKSHTLQSHTHRHTQTHTGRITDKYISQWLHISNHMLSIRVNHYLKPFYLGQAFGCSFSSMKSKRLNSALRLKSGIPFNFGTKMDDNLRGPRYLWEAAGVEEMFPFVPKIFFLGRKTLMYPSRDQRNTNIYN